MPVRGAFKERKEEISSISWKDFNNAWSFHTLCLSDDGPLYKWLRNHGLLASELICPTCIAKNREKALLKPCKLGRGNRFRCRINKNHDFSFKIYSFFTGCKHNIRDILLFVRCMLNGSSLYRASLSSQFSYTGTGINWSSYIRNVMKNYWELHIKTLQLSGIVEIDETLLGRKHKYNRGTKKGMRCWIFGVIERKPLGRSPLIIYPVQRRDAATLLPIIQRHVTVGSNIYSDSWRAYDTLNTLGYRHFTVCHKYDRNM